jgi:hypothetical protein
MPLLLLLACTAREPAAPADPGGAPEGAPARADPDGPDPSGDPALDALGAAGACEGAPLRVTRYALEGGGALLDVTCAEYAYQSSDQIWLETAAGLVPAEDYGGVGALALVGLPGFDPATRILSNLEKARGPGDCGTWTRRQLRGQRFVTLERRERSCDAPPVEESDPGAWPLVHPIEASGPLRMVELLEPEGYQSDLNESLHGCPPVMLTQFRPYEEEELGLIDAFDLLAGRRLRIDTGPERGVETVALSSEGAVLLAGVSFLSMADQEAGRMRGLSGWDVASGARLWELDGQTFFGASGVAPRRDGWFAVYFHDRAPLLIEGRSGATRALEDPEGYMAAAQIPPQGPLAWQHIDLDPARGRFASVGADHRSVALRALSSGEVLERIQLDAPVEALAYSPDGARLGVLTRADGGVRVGLYDPETGASEGTMEGPAPLEDDSGAIAGRLLLRGEVVAALVGTRAYAWRGGALETADLEGYTYELGGISEAGVIALVTAEGPALWAGGAPVLYGINGPGPWCMDDTGDLWVAHEDVFAHWTPGG